jgi:hypothetical protein
MLTAAQARDLSGSRNAIALSRSFTEEELALRYAQVGVPFVSEHAAYLTIHLRPSARINLERVQQLALKLDHEAQTGGFQWVAVMGVNCTRWQQWKEEQRSALAGELFQGLEQVLHILRENHPPYALDGGDLFFQIQSREAPDTQAVADHICTELQDVLDETKTNYTVGDSLHGGRIYGGRMLHGLISSVDPVCFSARAIIGNELLPHRGACFCLSQRFIHNWQFLLGMADNEMENLIGRDHLGNIITNDDERSHIKLVRVNDEDGLNYRLVGQSQPFRGPNWFQFERGFDPTSRAERLKARGRAIEASTGLPGKEDGIYQLSYAKSLGAFAAILQNMLGEKPGYIKCRHLNFSQADQGNIWYVPSAAELRLAAPHKRLTVLMNAFFDVQSPNG